MIAAEDGPDSSLLGRALAVAASTPRVALLMSGGGSNARYLLANRERYPGLNFAVIATDRKGSNAESIGTHFGVESFRVAISSDRDLSFRALARELECRDIHFLVYAGFMRIAPEWFVRTFPGVNSHPADLTVLDDDGLPRYRGLDALGLGVRQRGTLRTTVHLVAGAVDAGAPIVLSQELAVPEHLSASDYSQLHEYLKNAVEHETFAVALTLLERGILTPTTIPVSFAAAVKLINEQ